MSDTQTLRAGSAGGRRLRGGILDLPLRAALCRKQVGTKGWSFPIEQRDAALLT